MAENSKETIKCPKCGKTLEFLKWDVLAMPYDIEEKPKVMNNTFFKVPCRACNISISVGYKMLYNDMEKRYIVWVTPLLDQKEMMEIADYNKRLTTDKALMLAQKDYIYRIVRNDNELREKVIIFDEGLDDRIIEIMKVESVDAIRRNAKDGAQVFGVYFDKDKDGQYVFVAVTDKTPPIVVKADMKRYESLKDSMTEKIDSLTEKGFTDISLKWALNVIKNAKTK